MTLQNLINRLMGIRDITTLKDLEEQGFKEIDKTPVVNNYMLMERKGIKVLYDSRSDRVLDVLYEGE